MVSRDFEREELWNLNFSLPVYFARAEIVLQYLPKLLRQGLQATNLIIHPIRSLKIN